MDFFSKIENGLLLSRFIIIENNFKKCPSKKEIKLYYA